MRVETTTPAWLTTRGPATVQRTLLKAAAAAELRRRSMLPSIDAIERAQLVRRANELTIEVLRLTTLGTIVDVDA